MPKENEFSITLQLYLKQYEQETLCEEEFKKVRRAEFLTTWNSGIVLPKVIKGLSEWAIGIIQTSNHYYLWITCINTGWVFYLKHKISSAPPWPLNQTLWWWVVGLWSLHSSTSIWVTLVFTKHLIIQVGSLRLRLIKALSYSSTVNLLVKPKLMITVQCSLYSFLLLACSNYLK